MRGKVFLACALGGGIGALVALQIWQSFWWIGLIVGWLVGYIAYDFNAAIRSTSQAWAMAVAAETRRIYGEFLHILAIALGAVLLTGANIFLPLLPLLIRTPGWQKSSLGVSLGVSVVVWLLAGLLWVAVYFVFVPPWIDPPNALKHLMRRWNPLMLYCYQVPRGIWWLAKRTPRAVARGATAGGRFGKYLFLLIHSEMRLLCAFDAALGAAIGYFLGSAAIGALTGGVIGVANYEIVSKRLLHLVPSH